MPSTDKEILTQNLSDNFFGAHATMQWTVATETRQDTRVFRHR